MKTRTTPVPDDFPREVLASVSGAQPKLLVRKIGEEYIGGLTDEELAQRYELCRDLVDQLTAYAQRKHAEHPEWTLEVLFDRLRNGVRVKRWGLSEAEIQWIVLRVAAAFE
jgi:hypothetical protein